MGRWCGEGQWKTSHSCSRVRCCTQPRSGSGMRGRRSGPDPSQQRDQFRKKMCSDHARWRSSVEGTSSQFCADARWRWCIRWAAASEDRSCFGTILWDDVKRVKTIVVLHEAVRHQSARALRRKRDPAADCANSEQLRHLGNVSLPRTLSINVSRLFPDSTM